MSAPDTNVRVQAWYHRPPLVGMGLVVLGIFAFIFLAQLAPDDDAALTNETVAPTE